jgi:hypothetical protein
MYLLLLGLLFKVFIQVVTVAMFLLNLLPAMKQLTPLGNMDSGLRSKKPFGKNWDVLQLQYNW